MSGIGMASILKPQDCVLIHHVKSPRREDLIYSAVCVSDDGDHIVLSATRILPNRELGPVVFETGDLFIEHYWRSRWYGILQVSSSGNELKGWYGNISRPANVYDKRLFSHDLELDLWIPASGMPPTRLDEDEFAASGLMTNDPAQAERAIKALEELEHVAVSRALPSLLSYGGPDDGR